MVSFSLEVNVEETYKDVRRLLTILDRSMSLLGRLTGNETIDAAIAKIRKLIALLNALRLAIAAAKAALTGDPISMAMAVLAGIELGVMAGDVMMEMGSR